MKAIYHERPECFSYKTKVIGQGLDEAGHYLIFEESIFYPQGGGQPFDLGHVEINGNAIAVLGVKTKEVGIRHYIENECGDVIGQEAVLNVDSARRGMNSKLHSAGHLISHVVENAFPGCRAVKGHHFIGECYVEFSKQSVHEIDIGKIQGQIDRLIQTKMPVTSKYIEGSQLGDVCPNLSYKIPDHEEVRLIRIGDYDFQPCCGTHVNNLSELSGLRVTKQKQKGNVVKISYEIEANVFASPQGVEQSPWGA